MKERNKKKYTLIWLAFMLVNILIVVFIASREFSGKDFTSFFLGENGLFFLLGGIFCLFIIFFTETAKCFLIMRALGQKFSVRESFEIIALGRYYDALMPTGGGGQPFQIVWLAGKGYPTKTASVMPAVYFVTRQLASILITLIIFIVFPHAVSRTVRIASWLGLLFCCFIPFLELAFSLKPDLIRKLLRHGIRFASKINIIKNTDAAMEKTIHTLDQYHEGFTFMAGSRPLLLSLIALSLLCRAALLAMPYFALRTVGCSAAFGHVFILTVYIYSAVTLIPSPGNSGVSEGTFYYIFSELMPDSRAVFWAMLLWRGLCYYSFLLVGLLVFGRQLFSDNKPIER